jgi:hypothetical protein
MERHFAERMRAGLGQPEIKPEVAT